MRLPALLQVGASFVFTVLLGLGVYAMDMISAESQRQESARHAIALYALAERSLQLDMLGERAGLLRTYDPINDDEASGVQDLNALKQTGLKGDARNQLLNLAVQDERQANLIAEFNSENALIRNALDYIAAHGSLTGRQVFINRMLMLTLDTTPRAVREAQAELQRMPYRLAVGPARRLRSQAVILVTLLPHADILLSNIRALGIEERIVTLQAVIRADATHVEWMSRRLEETLAVIVLVLLSAVFALIGFQKSKTRDLRNQAANERLSAAIAMPLIDTGPGTLPSQIQNATDQLANHIGARKLQLLIPALAETTRFSQSSSAPPFEWLDKLVEAANLEEAWNANRVIRLCKLSPANGPLRQAMFEIGVENIILIRTEEPFQVIIGIEPADINAAQRRDYLAGISSAIIAVGHGVRREMMERERERLEQTIAQKQRMEKIGRIASGIAHNFNNITGAISGYAEMGQDITKVNTAARQKFDEIVGTVRRAEELIEAILTYARRRRLVKSDIDLCDLLPQTIYMMSASYHGEVKFVLERPETAVHVYGSGSELQQVILNVCDNAAQATKDGLVNISLDCRSLGERLDLSHSSLHAGNYAVITVSDRGSGIPGMVQRQLFEPFFTTKSAGTGLGLSTAWEIVQDHGGAIDVSSRHGGGSAMSVWLPELTATFTRNVMGNGERVLLLSDPDQLRCGRGDVSRDRFEPMGISLTKAAKRRPDLSKADAVVVVTSHFLCADKTIRALLPMLDGRPLLLSVPDRDMQHFPAPSRKIAYPLRQDDLLSLLPKLVETASAERRERLSKRVALSQATP